MVNIQDIWVDRRKPSDVSLVGDCVAQPRSHFPVEPTVHLSSCGDDLPPATRAIVAPRRFNAARLSQLFGKSGYGEIQLSVMLQAEQRSKESCGDFFARCKRLEQISLQLREVPMGTFKSESVVDV